MCVAYGVFVSTAGHRWSQTLSRRETERDRERLGGVTAFVRRGRDGIIED